MHCVLVYALQAFNCVWPLVHGVQGLHLKALVVPLQLPVWYSCPIVLDLQFRFVHVLHRASDVPSVQPPILYSPAGHDLHGVHV